MELIENIIRIMDEKHITDYKIEKDIGINQTTFLSWKKGSQPAADKIMKLIDYLEITPNEIFGFIEDEDPTQEEKFSKDNEKIMLKLFRQLTKDEQEVLLEQMEVSIRHKFKHAGELSDTKIG